MDFHAYLQTVTARFPESEKKGELILDHVHAHQFYGEKFAFKWMATKLKIFSFVSYRSEISEAAIKAYSGKCMSQALEGYGGLRRGMQSGVVSFHVLVSKYVDPKAIAWVKSRPKKRFAAFEMPVIYDLTNQKLYYYEEKPMWGSIYYSFFREYIEERFGAREAARKDDVATRYGAVQEPSAEDCLFENVFTPAEWTFRAFARRSISRTFQACSYVLATGFLLLASFFGILLATPDGHAAIAAAAVKFLLLALFFYLLPTIRRRRAETRVLKRERQARGVPFQPQTLSFYQSHFEDGSGQRYAYHQITTVKRDSMHLYLLVRQQLFVVKRGAFTKGAIAAFERFLEGVLPQSAKACGWKAALRTGALVGLCLAILVATLLYTTILIILIEDRWAEELMVLALEHGTMRCWF